MTQATVRSQGAVVNESHGAAPFFVRAFTAVLGAGDCTTEKGVRLAQTMQVRPRIPVGVWLENAEVGPKSGPTRRLSHRGRRRRACRQRRVAGQRRRIQGPLPLHHLPQSKNHIK